MVHIGSNPPSSPIQPDRHECDFECRVANACLRNGRCLGLVISMPPLLLLNPSKLCMSMIGSLWCAVSAPCSKGPALSCRDKAAGRTAARVTLSEAARPRRRRRRWRQQWRRYRGWRRWRRRGGHAGQGGLPAGREAGHHRRGDAADHHVEGEPAARVIIFHLLQFSC